MEPAANGAQLQSVETSFGLLHDPAGLMKRHPIMAMALGKDGKVVFERYQFGTSKSSTFDSQSIAKFITGLTFGAVIQKGTPIDLDTKMLSHVPKLEKSPIGLSTVRQTLQMQCGHQFKWIDDGTSEGSAGQYARVRLAAAAKGGRNLYEYFQPLAPTRYQSAKTKIRILHAMVIRLGCARTKRIVGLLDWEITDSAFTWTQKTKVL